MASVSRLSWDLQDPEGAYDPAKRYTQSTDKKGHSAWLKVRVPTQIAAEIARVVQSGRIPEYHSSQDLARDAIVHHLNSVATYLEDENLGRIITLTALYDDAMKRENDRKMFADYMDVLEENFRHLIDRKQYRTVRRIITELQESLDAVPEYMQEEFDQYLTSKLAMVTK